MTTEIKIEKQNFAAGEVGRNVRAHTDLARYQSGVELAENFVVLAEGVLTRRPGSKMIAALRNETQRGRLLPHRYDGANSYMVVLNDNKARFVKNGAMLGTPYEIDAPFFESELELLRGVAVGNIQYIAAGAGGRQPIVLTRSGDTAWAFSLYTPADGPFEIQNLDKTKVIRTAGTIGAILAQSSGVAFDAAHVGTLWRLDESNLALTPEWTANETIAPVIEAVPAGGVIHDGFLNSANAFDGNAATDAAKLAALTGLIGQSVHSRVRTATVKGSAGSGFCSTNGFIQLWLMGKTGGGPANPLDGVVLDTIVVADVPGQTVVLTANDQTTAFDHVWIAFLTNPADNVTIAEISFDRYQSAQPVRRRWNGNVYDALNNGNTGSAPPTHTEGDAIHGAVTWRYRNGPFGVMRIDTVFDANNVAATALTPIPDSVTVQPTYRWYPPAWSTPAGWPENVQLYGNRLSWTRKNRFWQTAPNTPLSFALTIDELSALAETLTQEDGTLPDIMWQMASGVLVMGARDGEWIERGPSAFDPLTPANIRIVSDSTEGSCPQVPARVNGGAVFVGRSRDRLHFAKFDRLSETLSPVEISKGARHVFERGVYRISYQRDPNRILWVRTGADGSERLAGMTMMAEEQILGCHRHPMARAAAGLPDDGAIGSVEDIATIPTSDEGRSDTYMIVRRVINGVQRRFVEQLQPFFQPSNPDHPTAAGAWFVDCGIRVTGAALTSVTAAHLKGATVRVFADGGDRGLSVCDAVTGAVAIDPPADDVLVGLPIVARVRDLPRNVATPQGPSKAAQKRANHATVEMVFSAGGKIRAYDEKRSDGGLLTALNTSGTAPFTGAVPLKTGAITETISGSYGDEVRLELVCDNALPFTLTGLMPKMQIGDA